MATIKIQKNADLQEAEAGGSVGIPFCHFFTQFHRCSSLGGRSQQVLFFGLEFVPRNYGIDICHIPAMGL